MAFSVNPTIYADFTTNTYIANGAQGNNLTSWLNGIGGTFSRSSTAYFTGSNGSLQPASSNVLRFDFDPIALTSNGVLLEGSSTNILLQSNNPSDAAWNGNTGITLSTASGNAPDGSSSATTVTATAHGSGTASTIQQNAITSTVATYTYSAYLRKNSVQYAAMWLFNGSGYLGQVFDLTNGILGNADGGASGSITKVANGWFRCTITVALPSGSLYPALGPVPANNTGISSQVFAGTESVDIAFMQVEALSIASSYIPTTSATVTRSADSLSWPVPSNFVNVPNSLYVKAKNFKDDSSGADFGGLSNLVGSNYVQFRYINTGIFGLFSTGPTLSVTGSGSDPGNSTHGVALAWNTGDYAVSVDGATPGTSSSGATVPVVTQFQILFTNNNAYGGFIDLAAVGFWGNNRLSNSLLQTLSNTSNTITFDFSTPINLSNKHGKYFSRKDYEEWLALIVGEDEESRREYQRFIDEAEAERNLTYIQRADRDYNVAEEQLASSENSLFSNLTVTNHIKFSEAKEKRDLARKERDHQYFMEVVNQEWAKYNEAKARKSKN